MKTIELDVDFVLQTQTCMPTLVGLVASVSPDVLLEM